MNRTTFEPGSNVDAPGVRSGHWAYCRYCGQLTRLLGPSDAARMYNTDLQDIEFLSERGRLHRLHNSRGVLMICSRSLVASFEERETRLLTFDTGLARQR